MPGCISLLLGLSVHAARVWQPLIPLSTCQALPLADMTVLSRYIAVNLGTIFSWYRMLRIDEEVFGGHSALMSEGFPPSMGLFLVGPGSFQLLLALLHMNGGPCAVTALQYQACHAKVLP